MILVTGATGFVGSALIDDLDRKSFKIRAISRKALLNNSIDQRIIESIDESTNWRDALDNIEIVIHSAARVHIMNDKSENALEEFRKTNTLGTINLAKQAAEKGVKRFIFLSSVKVNGEQTFDTPFTEEDSANPGDPYSVSKYEAELALMQIAKTTRMEVVIVRPPLVYGPKVKANFRNLLKLANSKIPLPFASINNQRSMVFVRNLTDFIIKCIDHPYAKNQIFLISDQHDLSLPELIKIIRIALNKSVNIFSVPLFLFTLLGWALRKQEVIARLTGKLQIDSSKATKTLNWIAPYTCEQAINLTVLSFIEENKK